MHLKQPTMSFICWHTETIIVFLPINIHINWEVIQDVEKFLESLIDEDKSNKDGKALFCEPCDVPYQSTHVKHYYEHQDQSHPHPNPEPHGQVV